MSSRRTRWLVPSAVLVLTLAADQASKLWARDALPTGHAVPVIDGFWDWELSFNPGAAFSTFGSGGARVALTLIGIGAILAIGWMLVRSRPEQRVLRAGLALTAGGALGNLIDRIGTGVVTDFVRWRWHDHLWPIFNVADVALVVGVALLLIDGLRKPRPRGEARAGP